MTKVNSKFKLALVELYTPYRHGFHKNKEHHHVYGHYIINYPIKIKEFYNDIERINFDLELACDNMFDFLEQIKYQTRIGKVNHPVIRNYEKIAKNNRQYELQIIEPITVALGNSESDEYSGAIIKTHWISLIQRRWREIRKKRINNMKNLHNLNYREIHGKFPSECNVKFNLGIS